MDETKMGEKGPLGFSGCTRCVEDERRLFFTRSWEVTRPRGDQQRRESSIAPFGASVWRRRIVVANDDAQTQTADGGRRRSHCRQLGVDDQDGGATIVQLKLQLGLSLPRAQRDADGTKTDAPEERDHGLPAVAEQKRHAIAWRHAGRRKIRGDPIDQIVQIAEADAARSLDDRLVGRIRRDNPSQHVVQVARTIAEAAKPTPVEMPLDLDRTADLVCRPPAILKSLHVGSNSARPRCTRRVCYADRDS